MEDTINQEGGPGWRILPEKSSLPTISKLVSIYGVLDWEVSPPNRCAALVKRSRG